MREVSIEGARLVCETVMTLFYRLDEETMVSLDITPEPLVHIEREKHNACEALLAGLPAFD
ncbi:MAG: hypothetical protein WAY93_06825 [Atopobiaceae bacterium]|jgi:hypothetical protein|nr:hypothetical protein [Atopobiaceae bacterium]